MEEARRCMNGVCRNIIGDGELRRGWGLRSGGSANLCSTCGTAFEQLIFCDMFHAKETGWRECNSCGKRLHCGCIASKSFVELLDDGGVHCVSCMKNSRLSLIPSGVLYELSTKYPEDKVGSSKVAPGVHLYQTQTSTDVSMDVMGINRNSTMNIRNNTQSHTQRSSDRFFGHVKSEQVMLSIGDMGNTIFSSVTQAQGSQISKHDENSEYVPDREPFKSLPKAYLDISLGICSTHNAMETSYNSGNVPIAVPLPRTVSEERENHKSNSSLQQVQRSRYLLPKPPRMVHIPGPDATKDAILNVRVARPPGEGRGRNQLLPRYWPRITDQELQQISGDSNSTIVPLFEKVLSASDAGRIGRLVLPKACAEAYFPPISQPEGLPLKIQDAKGKDWIFQFRFWPNNNSRMYVLEGVTPCIHSMQLQAGDTVTFSRIDPEGKLVMGFRKATNTVSLQDSQISAMADGSFCNENFLSGVIENLPVVTGYSGYETPKGSIDPQFSNFPKLSRSFSWSKMDYQGFRSTEGMHLQSSHIPEKRKGRNIGPKSKRLHIDSDDALELKLTWEEVQNLLCPPPSAKPNIVKIDDQEFEEYDEPPVLGKRTIFTAGVSGSHDQWAQCDACSKWRKLPMDVFVPPKWTCADNRWDPKRCSCSVPDEMSPEELQSFLHQNADFRRRKISAIYKPPIPEQDVSSLDALAIVASLRDDASPSTSSVATTTKHPRHRPGCTCIVCIQPPSGKGPKHKPSCTCNVCMTVRRRFKTLMLRKKQRQSEREEAETQKKLDCARKDEKEADNFLHSKMPMDSHDETEFECNTLLVDNGKWQIDLNCHPDREESQQGTSSRASMISLLRDASLPLEMYLKQNGLMSLACEQPQVEVSSSSHGTPQLPRSEGKANDESIDLTALEPEGVVEEVCGANDEACGGSDHNSK